MIPIKLPPLDTARHAVSKERASTNRRKSHLRRRNPAPGHHPASTPGRKRPQVKRIAVRFASPPPQSRPKVGITHEPSRKSLKVNHKIKAHPASFPHP